jgi:peptide/nickel transport system substrate-binding protein
VAVETMPKAQYFQRTPKKEFSACMKGWGDNNRDAMFTLRPLYHSLQADTGRGDTNYGNFRNPEVDALIQKAESEMDMAKRQALINDAIRSLQKEVNAIPLHRQVTPWVSRANVTVTHRPDNWLWPLWVSVK